MPQPFFRKQTKSWYVQIKGKQHPLGKDKAEAFAKYHKLMLAEPKPDADYTVAELADRFLDWVQTNQAERTYTFYHTWMQRFINHIGKSMHWDDLKPLHLTQWLGTLKGGDPNKNNAARCAKRLYNWAVSEGWIPSSPIAKYKAPPAPPREVYLTPEQWAIVIDRAKQPLKDALLFMRWTGCRPQELRKVEARHRDGKFMVLDREQSKGKKHRRVIPLPEQAFEIVTRLSARYPTGPLFRTRKGKPLDAAEFSRLCRELGRKVGFRLFPYAVRHTFCTDMLIKGMNPVQLAAIMGHKSLTMIMRVYSHLELKKDELRLELERALAG